MLPIDKELSRAFTAVGLIIRLFDGAGGFQG